MKLLVIGGSGFIGSRVLEALASDHEAVGTYCTNAGLRVPGCWLQPLNVVDAAAVRHTLTALRPEVVVLVCGPTSIEDCAGRAGRSKEALEANRVHVEGTRHVVAACEVSSSHLVYVSTDCVFDGSKPFFSETDPAAPFNAYGQMKRRGEEIIQGSGAKHAIVRVSLAFGWRRHPRQFRNFALRVLRSLRQSPAAVPAATNLFNTPIEVTAAAGVISRIALIRGEGIFHVASRDRLSRYEFARSVAEIFGFPTSRVLASEDNSGLRPPNSCLSTERTEAELSIRLEGFHEGLRRMKGEEREATLVED